VWVELCGADAELVQRLADEDPRQTGELLEVLDEHARQRRWNSFTDANQDECWARGQLAFTPDGAEWWNGAFVVLSDGAPRLAQVLWGAQIGVVLPAIDRLRERAARHLMRGYGAHDLSRRRHGTCGAAVEINDLAESAEVRRASRRVRRAVFWGRMARNRLAHLQALDYSDLTTGEQRIREALRELP